MDFDKFGSVLKRNGYALINTAATTAILSDGLYWHEWAAGGTAGRSAVEIIDSKFYQMDKLDGTWNDQTGAVTISSGNHCDFESYDNKVFMTNGSDTPWEWAGSGTAVVSIVPSGMTTATYVSQFNNYLFYGNVAVSGTDHPSRIYWSNFKDTSTWTATDFIDISKNDGQAITGLKVLSDRLVIYKEKSIYNLYFTGDSSIPFVMPGGGKSNSIVGCIAPFSIQEVENGHVFLAPDGIYFYDGLNSYKISDKITNTLIDWNKSRFGKAVSLTYKSKNMYWLAFSTSTVQTFNRLVIWDWFNNAFSVYVGLTPSALATFFVNGVEERPYFTAYDGYTYRADTGADDYPANVQTAIDAYYYTNWRHFGDICDQKGIPHVYIYHKIDNSTLSFSYSYEFEDKDQYTQTFNMGGGGDVYGTGLYGTATYGKSGGNVVRRDLTGRGRMVRFKFANNTLAEAFRIDGVGSLAHVETMT